MKVKDGIIGHAIGDAMGVPVEFYKRDELSVNPVTTMLGYGSHDVPAGSWSDDTSMEIATIVSIINKKGLDYEDMMMNFYEWLKDGLFTPYGEVFDAGRTCIQAIINFSKGYEWRECGLNDKMSNGNGSLMRMLPLAYYCYYKKASLEEIYEIVKNVSSLTHAHEISILGCYIYVNYVLFLLDEEDKFTAYHKLKNIDYSKFTSESLASYINILEKDISKFPITSISSSGYIIDTLEASLWTILNTTNFEESIIQAINLGEDTDTIGAITGSMSGIIYGYDTIPKSWLNKLAKRKDLENLCDEFASTLKEMK